MTASQFILKRGNVNEKAKWTNKLVLKKTSLKNHELQVCPREPSSNTFKVRRQVCVVVGVDSDWYLQVQSCKLLPLLP